jgi:hypothetical protein
MLARSKCQWILAGLVVVATTAAGGSSAHATSIGVKGHITPLPGGSPFLYTFELDLNNLSEGSITPGSSLTVGIPTLMPDGMLSSGLVGVTGQSGHQEPPLTGGNPNDFWVVPAGGIITSNTGNPAPFNQQSSIEWSFHDGPDYSTTGLVGIFTVETTSDFPDNMPPVIPNVTEINYVFKFADGVTDTGFITLSIPEPSSVILLLVGVSALPLARKWAKRKQAARITLT